MYIKITDKRSRHYNETFHVFYTYQQNENAPVTYYVEDPEEAGKLVFNENQVQVVSALSIHQDELGIQHAESPR